MAVAQAIMNGLVLALAVRHVKLKTHAHPHRSMTERPATGRGRRQIASGGGGTVTGPITDS
jgi:hypothetical protein